MRNWISLAGLAIVIPAALVVLGLLAVAGSEIRKGYWDRKVQEMCAKEGGIKVLKTVELDPDEYESY